MSSLRKKHKRNNIALKIIIPLIIIFIVATIGVLSAFGGIIFTATTAVANFIATLPAIEDFSPTQTALTSKIYAADGKQIATFHGEENRELVSLEQMPKNLINAVISIEDERFYQHKGVDLEGIVRAFLINLKSGEIVEGASTITQQVITSIYIPKGKTIVTYDRKIK
jgi:penicillin-binding protein 1A